MLNYFWSRLDFETKKHLALLGGILTAAAISILRSDAVWPWVVRLLSHFPM